MDKPKTTPKDFFLWAGAMLSLYVSVFAFISLIFDYLDYAFPDPLQYFPSDPYAGGISYEMASLIVLAPLAIGLILLIQRSTRIDTTRADIWVRRWALYLTLFIAGATIAIDLITLIMYFLQGDVTLRFMLKVAVVFFVIGAGFLHFIAELWGYWTANPTKARTIAWAVGVLIVCTIASGFFIVGTPWQARLYRFDDQKVSDLQNIQSQIVSYWQSKQMLPAELSDLQDSISGYTVPTDPQTNAMYSYTKTGALSFTLCADFNAVTQPYSSSGSSYPVAPNGVGVGDTWFHSAGPSCFERTIDPDRYPPYNKLNP